MVAPGNSSFGFCAAGASGRSFCGSLRPAGLFRCLAMRDGGPGRVRRRVADALCVLSGHGQRKRQKRRQGHAARHSAKERTRQRPHRHIFHFSPVCVWLRESRTTAVTGKALFLATASGYGTAKRARRHVSIRRGRPAIVRIGPMGTFRPQSSPGIQTGRWAGRRSAPVLGIDFGYWLQLTTMGHAAVVS